MYVYNEVRTALIGKDGEKSKDFSPNNVKCFVLGNGFIFIAYHTKRPKVVVLDMNEVAKDFQKGGSTGSLTNLLKKYQMSCLEEIYIGNIYMNNKGFLDLEGYVQTLNPRDSRLRYYGYIEGENPNELVTMFADAVTNHKDMWCYAMEQSRTAKVQYSDVGNREWYKRHSLRPDSYAIDKQGGALDKILSGIENRVKSKAEALSKAQDEANLSTVMSALYKQDLGRIDAILYYFTLSSQLAKLERSNSADAYSGNIRKLLSDVSERMKTGIGNAHDGVSISISLPEFGKYAKASGVRPDENLNKVLSAISNTFAKGSGALDAESYGGIKGLADRMNKGYGLSGFEPCFRSEMVKWVAEGMSGSSNGISKGCLNLLRYQIALDGKGIVGKDALVDLIKTENIGYLVGLVMNVAGFDTKSVKGK